MRMEFYVACFDRDLIIELKNEEDTTRAEEIMSEAYDRWCEQPEEVGDICCEEYICDCLKSADVDFDWIE